MRQRDRSCASLIHSRDERIDDIQTCLDISYCLPVIHMVNFTWSELSVLFPNALTWLRGGISTNLYIRLQIYIGTG